MSDEKQAIIDNAKPQALVQPKKLIPPLAGQNFTPLGQVCVDYHATPRPGITLKDVLVPSYWLAVANQMKPGCEIRVIPEDNSWYAKLLILSKDNISANVAVIFYSDFSLKSKVSADEFEIRSTQNNTRFSVFRKADGQVLRGGFTSERAASEHLDDYLRAAA